MRIGGVGKRRDAMTNDSYVISEITSEITERGLGVSEVRLTKRALQLADDETVWRQYRRYEGEVQGRWALEVLLEKHDLLLRKLAWWVLRKTLPSQQQPDNFEDFFQHARYGAILAYHRYQPEKSSNHKAKLATFVYSTVSHYLYSAWDMDSPVYIPTQKRGLRAYLRGQYDHQPEKKAKFEVDNNLTSDEAQHQAKFKHALLTNHVISLEHYYGEETAQNQNAGGLKVDFPENDTVTRVGLQKALELLSPLQQQIYQLFFQEEYSMKESAEKLGLNEDQVRGQLRTIRQKFARYEVQQMV